MTPQRSVLISLAMMPLIAIVVTLGFWLTKTYTLDQPYDEVWIGLNSHMPTPLRVWSCRTLRTRIGRPILAPYGCQGPGEW